MERTDGLPDGQRAALTTVRHQSGDGGVAVADRDRVTFPDSAKIRAQPGLELRDLDGLFAFLLHGHNMVIYSHVCKTVNARPRSSLAHLFLQLFKPVLDDDQRSLEL